MLLKILRIRIFQILINLCFLIDCKQKINDNVKLINDKWTNVKFLRKKSTILMLLQNKWFEFFNKHAMKIMNCKMKFRNRFSKFWYKCDESCWRCNFHTFWYNFVRRKRKTRSFRWNQWCKNYLKLEYLFWCCKSDERNKWISWSFWKCYESKYRNFCCCFEWNWWNCCCWNC